VLSAIPTALVEVVRGADEPAESKEAA